MADADRIWSGTLVASTPRTVELGRDYKGVEVLSIDGTAAIWITIGSVANPPKTPAAFQADADVIPATISSVEIPSTISGNTVVKLFSAGTPQVSVRGLL